MSPRIGTVQPWFWKTTFWSLLLPAIVTIACKKGKSNQLPGLIIFLQPLSWQQLPRLLPKLCFTNTLIQKAPSQRGEGSAAESSCKTSQHQDRAQEVNAGYFKATLPLEPHWPQHLHGGRWWRQLPGTAPENDTTAINTLTFIPTTPPPGS